MQYGLIFLYGNREGVGMAMGYRLDGPDSIPDSERFLSSSQHPKQLWGSPTSYTVGKR
jgi:hypothetical protein